MNPDLRKISRSFASVSTLYLLGIPLILVANIILARTLSVAEFGTFSFALSVATVLAIPISGGLPMLLTREVATYVQREQWSAYRGLIVTAYRWLGVLCVLIGTGLLAWWVLPGATPAPQLVIAFLLVPLVALNGARNGILKGLGRPVLAEAPVQVMQPSLLIIGYLGLAALGLSSATAALAWYFVVLLVVCIFASVMLWWMQPVQLRGLESDMHDLPRWRAGIVPFSLMSASTVLSVQTGVLLLGVSGQEEAVAQMRVAERGAQLVAFPLFFINAIIGPYIVRALKSGDRSDLRKITRHTVRLTLLISLPTALVLLAFGRQIIGFTFGAPYDAHAFLPMVILIVAQIVSVTLGNGGFLLAMTGAEKQTLYSLLLSLASIVIISLFLIETYGAVGAAIGAATGMIVAKIYVYFAVKRHLSISSGII